jgi:hypothetical protein
MTRLGWMVVGVIGVIIALIGTLVLMLHTRTAPVTGTQTEATTTERTAPIIDPSALSIYTNGEYGFSFFYPADGTVVDSFGSSTQTYISNTWRAGSSVKGTLIVQIQTSQGALTFGESTDAHERALCLTAGPAETKQGSVMVGSTTWQHFSFDKVGTENPQHIISYRTIQKNACLAFEIREPRTATASSTAYLIENSISSVTFAN